MERWHYPSGELYCEREEQCIRYFYPDGTLKTVESYENGRLHGAVFLYWPNGKLKRSCSFERGVRRGMDRMCNDQGELLDEEEY